MSLTCSWYKEKRRIFVRLQFYPAIQEQKVVIFNTSNRKWRIILDPMVPSIQATENGESFTFHGVAKSNKLSSWVKQLYIYSMTSQIVQVKNCENSEFIGLKSCILIWKLVNIVVPKNLSRFFFLHIQDLQKAFKYYFILTSCWSKYCSQKNLQD